MTWWAWTLLWLVLVAGALGVFFVLGRSLWRSAAGLFTELGTAADRMGAVSSQLETLGKQVRASQEPAVFADPVALRREREARARQRARQARKARQARARSALAPTGAGRAGAVRAGAAGGRVRPAASPRPGSTYDGRVTPPRED